MPNQSFYSFVFPLFIREPTHHLGTAQLEVGASVPENVYFPGYEESILPDAATIRTLHTTKYSQANPGVPTGSGTFREYPPFYL